MLFEDTYNTIDKLAEGLFKEKGSKFISLAVPVKNEQEVKDKLAEVKKSFHDARHHCYAYRLGIDKSSYRYNDDGEPSGTAGRPIYGQILSKDLTNILIIVVRYFGGTKLGVSGLINAYKLAAKYALENSTIITNNIYDIYRIDFRYEEMNKVMKIIKEFNLNMITQDFDLSCMIKIETPKKVSKHIFEKFSLIKNLKIKYLHTS